MSWVYTRLTTDKYGNVLENEGYEWTGEVALCKGGDVAKQQLDQQNKLQQQAFQLMQDRQNQVNSAVGKYLSNDIGFDPAQLATMRAQFLNQMGTNYNQAGANLRTAMLRRGSADSASPVGGDYVRGVASLEGGLASDSASGLANIDLNNLQQALTNKFNAASLINGQAAQMTSPIQSFSDAGSNALKSYVTAQNSGWLSQLMGGLGSGLGQGLGAGISGGFGSVLSGGKKGGANG